jgi:hypothetical protein
MTSRREEDEEEEEEEEDPIMMTGKMIVKEAKERGGLNDSAAHREAVTWAIEDMVRMNRER